MAKNSRKIKPFPAAAFEDALIIPNTILTIAGAAGKARRLTLFEKLEKSPDSGASRQLVVNSGRYGLTTGGYQAEHLELTPDGKLAVDPESNAKDRLRARFKLAIDNIPPFKQLFDLYAGSKLPSQAVMKDSLVEASYDAHDAPEGVDTFIANAQFLGLIKTISGSERLLTLDHALDEIKAAPIEAKPKPPLNAAAGPVIAEGTPSTGERDWEKTCFYISPIGADDSEERKHSNLVLGSFVEPAVEKLGLKVVRADQIGDPGMITTQVIEHIKKSKLAIVDLSYLNPNVLYELALRHALRLPTVQLIRKRDRLPFDIGQVRTVILDMTDIFTLVPKIEVYISEITTQARSAIENPDIVGNPISIFYSKFYDSP